MENAELEEIESDTEVLTSEISEMKNNTVDNKKEKPERFKAKKEGKTALNLFFEKMGFTVIDNRDDGGYLWVLGKDDMLKKAVDAAQKKFGYVPGQYDKNPDVGFKDGFCTKSKK